uniref:Late expression factor 3 n=1 Tax=Mamestra brassicae nuclear polyhedrosis virus TaxID=78219 RepID=Q4LEM7_NPVMB|nr:late expression factor 3 [Mamestra brassicae multiple nucleopolyhedrovirus]
MSDVEQQMEQIMQEEEEKESRRPAKRTNNESAIIDSVSAKRLKNSPQKRVSSGSTGSEKANPRKLDAVTGQLTSKNYYCVNNKAYYFFNLLVDNVSKTYYGDASHFQQLRVDATYTIEPVCDKSDNKIDNHIYISKVTECKNVEKIVVIKRFVEQNEFDCEETVSVVAKFKYGFKLLDSDLYKCVYVINYGDSYKSAASVQVECQANFRKWAACIKDETIMDEHMLLEYFSNVQDQMVNLYRVKCQQSNGNYKNFALQNMTQMSIAEKPVCKISEDDDNIISISRSNKRVIAGAIEKLTVERQSNERFTFNYVLEKETEPVRAYFYVKQQNDKKNDKLLQMETDLNQLNDLIVNNVVRVYIYVVAGLNTTGTTNYNVLGLTKQDLDDYKYSTL